MVEIRAASILDDAFLGHLVETALSVYLTSSLEVYSNYSELRSSGKEFNLLITNVGNVDGTLLEKLKLDYRNSNMQVIVLGVSQEAQGGFHYISNTDLILGMTREIAKIFGISAEDLSKIEAQKRYRIPRDLLYPGLESPCSIHAEISEGVTFQILDKAGVVDAALLGLLDANQCKYVQIPASFRVKFFKTICERFRGEMPKLVGTQEVYRQISGMQDYLLESFSDQPLNKQALTLSQEVMSATLETVKAAEDVNALLQSLFKDVEGFRYKHTCLTTYFCSLIIDNSEFGNDKQKEILGYAALFHDMFLRTEEEMKIQSNAQVKKLADEKSRQRVENHARICARYFESVNGIPMGVTNILKEHHGVSDGVGFDPKSLAISPLSIVFAIAEHWAKSLLLLGSNHQGRSVHHSLEMTRNKFDHYLPFRRVLKTIDEKKIKGSDAA